MKRRLLSALLALYMSLTLLPGVAWASVDDGQVDLKPASELRWIDRVELPDYALTLYKTLEEAADGDGYKDYLIEDEYYDLEGDNIRTDMPGEFMRGTVTSSDGSTTRYTAILVTTTETKETDQNTKEYIANCIRTAVSAFKFDHQEVFWIKGVYRIEFNRNGRRYYGLALCANRSKPDVENASYYEIRRPGFRTDGQWDIRGAMAQRDADVEKILGTIPAGADRFVQIYYLNKWLAANNQYNTTVKKDGDGPWYAYECISALEGLDDADGPVCSGYASAFKVLCDKLGIPCVTVTGRVAKNTGHRWNYIQMEDGKWYAVDVTYDDRNDNSANLTKWLLVGSKTVVNRKEFLETHPVHNRSYYAGGTDFTNGPVLSDEAYPRSVHLAYWVLPETLTPGDPVAMTPVLIFASDADYTYSSTPLPEGLTLNPDTGEITGTITDNAEMLLVTVTAADPTHPTDTARCTLEFPLASGLKNTDVARSD
ncbi:MAG: putative Ig domain-containing protein [Lachnospiraceae bacterium]|nr:putative Ig domain-containing protein [Lachnospiraceae bacterium]